MYFVHIQADCVFCILADVVFHKKEEQEIREEFLKLDTDRSGFITKGERFKMFEILFAQIHKYQVQCDTNTKCSVTQSLGAG